MEALLNLYINIEREISFLYELLNNDVDDLKFRRISKTLAFLVESRNGLKAACHEMSNMYCGDVITRYEAIVCRGHWRDFA